jgi:predicted DsbA family dithiol-disulfide isomerase
MGPEEQVHQDGQTDTKQGGADGSESRVLIFYDYACPFCYVDQFRFDRLENEQPDVEFALAPFELRPDMPEEGYQMSELEAAGQSDRVEDHLVRIAQRDGFPMQMC